MGKNWLFLTIFLVIAQANARTGQLKVIYGDDNRNDVFMVNDPKLLELAKSTAAMIPRHSVVEYNSLQSEIRSQTLQESGVCLDERFSQQPTAAKCSGFLVGKNKLITAGHCMRNQFSCDNNLWVFDYKVDHTDQSEIVVDNEKVYRCKKIVSQALDLDTELDYALIELEREVVDREVLKVSRKPPQVGDELVVIGHPSGLPTKIADDAQVRSVNNIFLVANLDTYGGNSGSAVFNSKSGEVIGILVRGEQDYILDNQRKCRVSNVVESSSGRGEDVTLISKVEGIYILPEQQEVNDDDSDDSTDSSDDLSTIPNDDQVSMPPAKKETWWQRLINFIRNLFKK